MGLFDLILGTRKAVRLKLLPVLEPRISRTKFVVLVELKSEPFISCTRVCEAPCLVLKARIAKVKTDSTPSSSAAFQSRFLCPI